MKRKYFGFLVLAAVLCMPFVAARGAAGLKDPAQILKKSQDYVLSLNSYSYSVKSEGWDTNPGESAKRVSSAADEASEKFGSVAGVAKDAKDSAQKTDTSKWIYKKVEVENKFMKPYLIRQRVVMSDYTPKVIWGSSLTYRPDKDPKVFWFKPKISPTAIKRDVTGESGGLPSAVLAADFAIVDALAKNMKPSFKGVKTVAVGETYVVEFAYPKNKKLKTSPVDFKKYGVPKEVQKVFQTEINKFLAGEFTARAVFYFDTKTLMPVMREEYQANGKLLWRRVYTEIKVNSLVEKDF